MVEVIRHVCCLSVIRDYFQLSKYNLANICEPGSANKPAGASEVPESNDTEQVSDAASQSDAGDASEPDKSNPDPDPNAKGEPAPELDALTITQDSKSE